MDILQPRQVLRFLLIIAVSVLAYLIAPESMNEASKRMLGIFIFGALCWGTEALPLFTTSLLIVLLETLLLCRPGGPLNLTAKDYNLFMLPWGSPIIMLFFGGFTLAAALHKQKIDIKLAKAMLKLFGNRPFALLVGFMLCTAFLSMWMSNTATTAMMLVMLKPILKQIESTSRFKVGLILGVTFGANIGGIGTPVGTPPNAVALGLLAGEGINISFLQWMMMALPLVILLLAITSVMLYSFFPAQKKQFKFNIGAHNTKLTHEGIITAIIALATVFMWLSSQWHGIPSSLVALLAAGAFATMGILKKDDLKQIDWDVLVLMWGGLSLGKGMQVTGLTDWIVALPLFEQQGFVLVLVFSILAVVLSTLISNTATANMLVPIALSFSGAEAITLALMIALSCSFAMALPVSTPPNAMAFSTGNIQSKDLFKSGISISIIALIFILAGYRFVIPIIIGS